MGLHLIRTCALAFQALLVMALKRNMHTRDSDAKGRQHTGCDGLRGAVDHGKHVEQRVVACAALLHMPVSSSAGHLTRTRSLGIAPETAQRTTKEYTAVAVHGSEYRVR